MLESSLYHSSIVYLTITLLPTKLIFAKGTPITSFNKALELICDLKHSQIEMNLRKK